MELLFASLFVDHLGVVWVINAYFIEGILIHETMNTETGCVWATDQAFSIAQVCDSIEQGNFDNGE